MFQNKTPPIKPLNVENVFSAGLRIYRDNFKSYFGVSIRANLWFLLPFLALIPVPLFFMYGQPENLLFLLLIPIWLLLFLYCSAKSIVNSAIIARLVFGELVNQPETVREARRIMAPKIWAFFLALFLLFLMEMGIWLCFSMVIGIIAGIITAIMEDPAQQIVGILAFLGLIVIILFPIFLNFYLRLLIRFFIIDIPLAVEENITATQTIGRSWELTKGYVGRIFLILIVGVLITIPIGIIQQIIATEIKGILLTTVPTPSRDPSFQILSFLIRYIIGLLGNLLLLPFRQAIKAVVYYDLRTHREGIGLELRKREI
ncbi:MULTISPECIES: DUF975 domain-containing protein [Okeania]|uniref:DUF975 domain-containing protein n=2 Tax=Okeania TaxID=1458928 RepID=A0A3N6PAE5_9CYAN|nr:MULTISPECIES: DUF975 domain-containing protein [Okeania]NES87967.1 DUF975 domain-containing protein [Okeania sp. SIO2B9]RQH25807.1 DUF975 domain-containing protein [Okeania hirsuta]